MALLDSSSAFLEPLDYDNKTAAEKAYIDALILVGQTYLEDYCQRKFEAADYTDEVHNGSGDNALYVFNPPINTLTNIKIVDSFATSDSDSDLLTTRDDAEFLWDSRSGVIQFKPECLTAFPEGFQNIRVTYNGGFAAASEEIRVMSYLNAQFVIETFDPSEKVDITDRERLGDYFWAKTKDFAARFVSSNKRLLSMYKLWKIQI